MGSLSDTISQLPELPGVYQFFDSDNRIIYIGKAKNLRKRVRSYFNRKQVESFKQNVLVKKIASLQYIVTETESDALLLENVLIKKHQPKYNVLLKDDKTYPWICIKNEPFPRVIITRRYIRDGSIYFGPYTSGRLLRTIFDLIRQLYPLRNCKLNLSESSIRSGKYRSCLEYQIGNCLAPCIGLQSEKEYRSSIDSVKKILQGDLDSVIRALVNEMNELADAYKFEKAQLVKEKIEILKNYQSKSSIINSRFKNLDVFTILQRDDIVAVNFIKVKNGAVIQSYNLQLKNKADESLTELFSTAITEIRVRMNSTAREVIVNCDPDFKLDGIHYTIPVRGDKKAYLDLSSRNLEMFILQQLKEKLTRNPKQRTVDILTTIKDDLRLKSLPEHIECFDNSNLQGSNPVASCVVFLNARPARRQYRHYNIKTVEGPDDYASMREVVYRRYSRLLSENKPLPQLVVIDGGKGQLNAAVDSLKRLNLLDRISVIGIAKRLEEIFMPGDPVPVYLDKRSETLRVIQHIRNEAHRFGITFHRNKRSNAVKSELESIKGIGEKTIRLLYTHFKSFDKIKAADSDELSALIGSKRAQILLRYFENH